MSNKKEKSQEQPQVQEQKVSKTDMLQVLCILFGTRRLRDLRDDEVK